MYNPSKEITRLLEQYLEFDAEQLKLGIWSGQLSLKDVNLKADAIYPHLNQFFSESEASSNEFTKTKPPVRLKLVSGTIGDLHLNIPWQSLVWGQGDVKVELRNVVVVVALESLEETRERLHKKGAASEDLSESSGTRSVSDSHDVQNEDPATKARRRYQKQKIMREAERRQLQGRDIASWLERVYKKEEEERQREALRASDALDQKEGQLKSWLKGATKGFFWRFYAGLQMKLENLKIIVIQDSVEMGLIVPSIQVLAGKQEPHRASATSSASRAHAFDDEDRGNNNRESQLPIVVSKPPTNVMYESPDEDGEHVDKHIRILGLGIYVRKLSGGTSRKIFGGDTERLLIDTPLEKSIMQLSDVSAKEYLLRPTELNISYSLFYPYPPEKRKKKKPTAVNNSTLDTTNSADTIVSSVASQSTGSGKRRRGKRDKASVSSSESQKTPPTLPGTPTTGRSPSAHADVDLPSGGTQLKDLPELASSSSDQPKPKRQMVMRRASIGIRQQLPIQQPSKASATWKPERQALETHRESVETLPSASGESIALSASDWSSPTAPIPQAKTTNSYGQFPPSTQLENQSKPRFARRSSMAAPVKGSTAAAAVVSRVPKPDMINKMKSVPLARPDDITTGITGGMKDVAIDLTARLDGNVQVGPVQVVLSTRHYNLIDNFLSACARMRNGRPSKTVASVLENTAVRHSVIVSSSEMARVTLTENAAAVRLGLNAPRTDRSKVVRSWWRYGLYAIRWEIQQRRKVRKHFQDKFLSFSWEQQRYRRKEYVTLYIASKLLSPEEVGALASDSAVTETLLSIEDELPVEQILLYRAIARILHVGGNKEMPDSIVGIRATSGYRGRALSDDMGTPVEHSQRSSSGYGSDEGFDRHVGHNRTMLSVLEETCEISRLRIEKRHGDVLPRHRELVKFSFHERKSKVDESTVGMTLDTRTDRRSGAGFSRAATRRSQTDQTADTSMKLTFSGALEKVEFMVIEEDLQYETSGRAKAGDDESSVCSNVTVSEISELTEEEGLSDSATQVTGLEEESASDLVMASTDFLLFRQPERHLLRTEVRNVSCTAFAQASGSKSFVFKIGRVQALAGNSLKLLDVGSDEEGFASSDSALGPQVLMDDSVVSRAALTLSLALQKDQRVVQCDVATIKTTFDQKAIASLLSFGTSSKSPRPLMPLTPGENVRMYVVNQNIGTAYRFFDASFRLHGIEVMLRKEFGGGIEQDMEGVDDSPETRAIFIADMIEVYSGQAANKLGIMKPQWHDTYASSKLSVLGEHETPDIKTRRLRMIDVDDLISKKSAFLAFNVVAAVSGLDFVTATFTKGGVEESRLSFFDCPIDIEMFASVNESSILDYNRAKREVVIKVSEVNALVSETRLKLLAEVIPRKSLEIDDYLSLNDLEVQPRVEILARFMLNSFDISFSRLRFSLVTDEKGRVGHSMLSKSDQVEDFVSSFLQTVSKLDLSWPHEEALSSAMQICIDRLTGVGFPLDDAWQCANTALLNFLEDIAGEDGGSVSEDEEDIFAGLIHGSVMRTAHLFTDRFDECDPSGPLMENHLVLDFPNGMSVTAVDLFYDHFVALIFSSLFVTNGDGIHLLRLMPEAEQADGSGKQDLDARSDAALSLQSSKGSCEGNPAFVFRLFKVNEKYSFGRGGLPLSVLGGEIEKVTDVDEECIIDIDMGEIELLFCSDVYDDVMFEVSRIADPLQEFLEPSASSSSPIPTKKKQPRDPIHVLSTSSCVSLLFTNEEMVPFTRLILGNCVASSESKRDAIAISSKVSSKQISVLYLAPAGELYPEQVCAHEMTPGAPLTLLFDTDDEGNSMCRVEFRGTRVFMVYQYIAECLQYFHSGTVGFGLWMANSSEALAKFNKPSPQTKKVSTEIEIVFIECSVLVPRSSLSSDMVAFEVAFAKLSFDQLSSSFQMATGDRPLEITPSQKRTGGTSTSSDSDERSKHEKDSVQQNSFKVNKANTDVSRTNIVLHRFRVYSSMTETKAQGDSVRFGVRESLAFNCFFEIDGRAEENKKVYRQVSPTQNYEVEKGKAERCWREISRGDATLNIVVDYAPHLRILITDDFEGSKTPFELDVTLSQFCLLMSCWYDNMSELPVMFPKSASDLEVESKFIADAATFPEFGTEEYRKIITSAFPTTSEFAMSLSSISIRCTSDPGRHFESVSTEAKGILLGLEDCTLETINDSNGATKVGLGALGARLLDDEKVHCHVVDIKNCKNVTHSWADLTFGTSDNCNNLIEELPLPFQMTIFLAPKSALYNLGMDSSVLTLSDFTTIFGFLGFVSVYFCEMELGYPHLRAFEFLVETKKQLMTGESADESSKPGYLTDFRLWLSRPVMWIPIDPVATETPFLILASDKGLWYRCATIDLFLSQECIVKGLALSNIEKNDAMAKKRNLFSRSLGKALFEGLSLGLRIDYCGASNHTDYAFKIPYNDEWGCSVTSKRISVDPVVALKPTILKPLETLDKYLGPTVCELTCVIDVLPETVAALSNLFIGPSDADDGSRAPSECSDPDASKHEHSETENSGDMNDDPEASFSFSGRIGDLRVFALDPVLGPHLPVAVVSVASLKVTASKFSEATDEEPHRGESPPEDLQLFVDGHMWADSFKLGSTRSWEPLLEAYRFNIYYETSRYRGSGVTLVSDVPLHFNITGANLMVADEVADSILRQVKETFGSGEDSVLVSSDVISPVPTGSRERVASSEDYQGLCVVHEFPRTLSHGDRVAFSLKNMTGQYLRAYRPNSGDNQTSETATLCYVENETATRLLFQPSVSMVSNMQIVEVDYPGLENSPSHSSGGSGSVHELDIQIPGFQWMRAVKIDNFGRHFVSLTPRSRVLRERAREDWRINNVMKLLVEVGLENGGRELTARSIFSVVNKTTHSLSLVLNPNPTFIPGEDGDEGVQLESGCVHQIPVLLIESALRQAGGVELGCIWMRPSMGKLPISFYEDHEVRELLSAHFSSRPVKLGKMVSDSALLFKEGSKGNDIPPDQAETGLQISCPVTGGSGELELAPFCYAVEVGRSPIVKARQDQGPQQKNETEHSFVHGPVAYTLSVFAPFVIANLLPEAGRFELMHAVRRTVVWFADLEPGQQVSVHSVGLDAPLLLLINLRFCRTPIGEGALVHHGVDPPPDAREHLGRLRSLGKAGKAATKQLGKALTSLGDTPDKRGQQLLYKAKDKQNSPVGNREKRKNGRKKRNVATGDSGFEDVDGKTYRVDTTLFFPEHCVEETVVVDGVGQRLTLGIENIRGGGGQRRVSVYCPFWIVNTTEHALMYRQYNSKHFVSGSVSSKKVDGSRTLSGGHLAGTQETNENVQHDESYVRPMNENTVFAGTPGALATSRGRCDLAPDELAPLLQEVLSLNDLSRLAFMFNFHEGSVPGSNQKLCVQLHDGTSHNRYISDWSRGFGLDSVGISQIVEMNCKDGRSLELSMVSQTAPGHLAHCTKIVRFLPRYVVVNNLPYPVRLWQDNSIFRPPSAADITLATTGREATRRWRLSSSRRKKDVGKINQYEALWGREVDILADEEHLSFPEGTTAHPSALHVISISPSDWKPFNLPDTRGDRQIRLGLGGCYNLTASISADVPGEHTLRLSRAIDLRLLKHVSTRASPQYTITLPPATGGEFSGELGIWFETEWGTDRSLIVKAIRYNSYAYNKTDVHVGDELLVIDGEAVARMTFQEAMNMLRKRIGEIRSTGAPPRRGLVRKSSLRFGLTTRFVSSLSGNESEDATISSRHLTLTFRTVEERLRRVRLKAARNNASRNHHSKLRDPGSALDSSPYDNRYENFDPEFLKAELRTLHKSMYLVLGSIGEVPYEVHNRTQSSTVYFRQRGCFSHPWRTLKPGASEVYCWEEPMKAKRLTVRVATEDSFAFATQNDNAEQKDNADGYIDADVMSEVAELGWSALKNNFFSRNVRDEEDSEFSQSVNVRLEEIGFREFLHFGHGERSKHLELEVDVVGSTRVLVVRDISSGSDTEDQLMGHLSALTLKCAEEEARVQKLRDLQFQLPVQNAEESLDDDENANKISAETLRKLMHDYPEEKSITRIHQMVVEVMEATGLSPDNYVGVCNPYVELSLRSGSTNLFQSSKQYYRTYFVRKSVNPCWNSQAFVFDIPPEAVSITRGHAVKVKVRNFRRIGRHAILGRAQIDLHSVKGQSPLLGWFPLAGRTGRRELENSLSHWGRGSIKLKIHWVYSFPGLIEYVLILSEARLADLYESVHGMAAQMDKRREEERKKQERIDGFKAVRVNEAQGQRKSTHNNNFQPRLRMEAEIGKSHRRTDTAETQFYNSHAGDDSIDGSLSAIERTIARRNTQRHTTSLRPDVEDQISLKRQQIQMGSLAGHAKRLSSIVASDGVGGTVSIGSFSTMTEAQVFFNDESITMTFDGQKYNVRLRRKTIVQQSNMIEDSSEERQLAGKLHVPMGSPSLMREAAREYRVSFVKSRASFERFARSSLRAALNPGGWLTIRPVQALNLPDTYNGMFVKVRYGSESFVSETVDSTVYPTWFKPNAANSDKTISADSLEYFPGDLHIFVPPQKTSGSIRLSVVGEGQGQRLNTKTELGVLHIPLGAAITACIDAVEEYFDGQMSEDGSSPVYLRWFPLEDPKGVLPVEGDRRNGIRPKEAEKDSDHLFNDYFSKCIQLAFIWSPEIELAGGGEADEFEGGETTEDNRKPAGQSSKSFGPGTSARNHKQSHASMVESYFNADIGQISFALIDSNKARELISGCVCDVDVRYWVTKAKTRFGVAIGWFQLDQQDDYAREPIILAPTPSEYIPTVLQILALKDNLRSKNDVLSFEFIDFSVAEFDITLEETLLSDVADFLSALRLHGALASKSNPNEGSVEELSIFGEEKSLFEIGNTTNLIKPEESLISLLSEGNDETRGRHRVYIEQLFLGVVRFNLSYLKGTKETRTVMEDQLGTIAGRVEDTAGGRIFGMILPSSHHEKSDIFSTWSQHTADRTGGAFSLPSLFTSLLPTVSDAPVRLQGKALNHVFESPSEIIQSIRKFYVNETLKQIYKIIGSLDFVGNPTMLFTSFLSGLRDLILVPSQAFIKSPNPSSVGLGFAQGTLSLFSHSASGFFGFTSKIFAAAGQCLASVSCDRDFRTWHRDSVLAEAGNLNRTWKKRGVQSARQMIVRPLGDLALGVGSGLVGVVLSPIKGYRRSGHLGFAMGMVAGVSGILLKPAVGVLDALSHFTASIHDIAKSVNLLEKRFQPATKYRLPYVFGTSMILMSFDDAQARAFYLLRLFPLKTGRRNAEFQETLVHVEVLHNIGIDTYAIVTSARLILIRLKKGGNGSALPSLCWQVAIVGGASVFSQIAEHGHNGFALTITLKKKANQENDQGLERNSTTDSIGLSHGSADSDRAVDEPLIGVGYEPGTEDFGYGTSRGEGGELLEWFTVVAEYQYRRQLAKLHNAISCVAGNLDDVIRDPALGRNGSKQFYTAFGIYNFEQRRTDEENATLKIDANAPVGNFLEGLPWRLDNEYQEKEPEWLMIAYRRAANAALELSTPILEQSQHDTSRTLTSNPPVSGPVRKIARWIRIANRLPTIVDTEEENPSSPRNEGDGDAGNVGGRQRKENQSQMESTFESADIASPSGLRRMNRSRSFDSADSDSFMTAAGDAPSEAFSSVSDSFKTAQSSSLSQSDSLKPIGTSGIKRFKSVSFRESAVSGKADDATRETVTPVPFVTPPIRSMPPRGKSTDTEIHSNRRIDVSDRDLSRHSITNLSERPIITGLPESRLTRMENIMEQLLLFSSEQALHNLNTRPVIPVESPNTQSLVEQISRLQLQLERQNKVEKEAYGEIEKLREQVSRLTELVATRRSPDSRENRSLAPAESPGLLIDTSVASSPESEEAFDDELRDLNGSWVKSGEENDID
ncbi:hypothetical protein ACA910_020005 [Epithemia clementina (nom. ined.)]